MLQNFWDALYKGIFDIILDIIEVLGLLSHPLIATNDGMLFDTFAKYKGCTYFEKEECSHIPFPSLLPSVRKRVLQLIHHPRSISLSKTYRVRTECPSTNFPDDVQKPKIDCLSFSFIPYE